MRLDKYIASTGSVSRKEAASAAKKGLVLLNGKAVKDLSVHIKEDVDTVVFCGEKIEYKKYRYIMLNKPQGYISSTEDSTKTVMKLLPAACSKIEMFPCGRLDIDTVGLLIITNDGPLAHRLLSPNHHAKKTYYYECQPEISTEKAKILEAGIDIGGYTTKPCSIDYINATSGNITLTEGKFHQIKRMFEAIGSSIVKLKRVSFGGINLDPSLNEGEWRYLTDEEIITLNEAK